MQTRNGTGSMQAVALAAVALGLASHAGRVHGAEIVGAGSGYGG